MGGLFVNVGQESVQLGWNAGTNTLTGTGPRGALFTVELTNPATGAYKVTLLDNVLHAPGGDENDAAAPQTGRGSCRGRRWQYGEISGVRGTFKKKTQTKHK